MPNRLAYETSPYLLQHKDNPVDWYPWGDAAFASAKLLDKPILLSIGYSSCHWCHVMAHESFENESIAAMMNNNFVNIKVDREELPDVDSIYMTAVQAMTGSGGWPLTVFLTPDGQPFFGGTYFPPEDRQNMAGFPRVLTAITETYMTKRSELLENSRKIVDAIRSQATPRKSDAEINESLIFGAFTHLVGNTDPVNGGTMGGPKFPQPMVYELMLRYWKRTGSSQMLEIVEQTLNGMANGGIYDQVGGGFARYSVDESWLVPHFEKMLYDNAQLVSLYTHAYQATKNESYARIVTETLEYVRREMTHSSGGFFSASDADSEGVEGKFFVWTPEELKSVLTSDDAELAIEYWGVTDEGNFEGSNVLHVPSATSEFATNKGISESDLLGQLERIKVTLLDARSGRVAPGIDDKILTSWNALMLKAFAESGAVFQNKEWVEVAKKNADLLLNSIRDDEGRLLHTWKATSDTQGEARILGYLDDHAYLVDALVSLYESTFESEYLENARQLADAMIARFWDQDWKVFYDTSLEHSKLIVRPRDVLDNAVPSGGAVAASALYKLGVLTDNQEFKDLASESVRAVVPFMEQAPAAVAAWLGTVDLMTSNMREVVVIGVANDSETDELVGASRHDYQPNMVFAGAYGELMVDEASPLLQGRGMIDGKPAAYVCENYACKAPVSSVEELQELLT